MKANLEFDLPEEQDEFECCINAAKWKSVCFEYANYLRHMEKYSEKETVSIEVIRKKFYDCLADEDLTV